jgi:hypothetical protein
MRSQGCQRRAWSEEVLLPEENGAAASEATLARRAHAYFVNASAPVLATCASLRGSRTRETPEAVTALVEIPA